VDRLCAQVIEEANALTQENRGNAHNAMRHRHE